MLGELTPPPRKGMLLVFMWLFIHNLNAIKFLVLFDLRKKKRNLLALFRTNIYRIPKNIFVLTISYLIIILKRKRSHEVRLYLSAYVIEIFYIFKSITNWNIIFKI